MLWRVFGTFALVLTACGAAAAAEVCYAIPGGQFGEMRWCVSSVLPPQAGNTYGPEHLSGSGGDGA